MTRRAPRALAILAALCTGASLRAQRVSVTIRDGGPGPLGQALAAILASPHTAIAPAPTAALLPRDSSYRRGVIVLARDVSVEGRVHGDVIVVGGNAFVHPGAMVDGRVIAIGGGAYASALAIVRDGLVSYLDVSYDVVPTSAGYALVYREAHAAAPPVLSLPGARGVRVPTYDRSNGLSLAAAPVVRLDRGRMEIEPALTYRSNLGAFDPSLAVRWQPAAHATLQLFAGRATLSNELWIWPDLVNSLSVLALGADTRNYFRADRLELTAKRTRQGHAMELEPFLGARVERDRPVGPDSFATVGPWSITGQNSPSRMLRPNPPTARGSLAALLAGARWEGETQGVRAKATISGEGAAFRPSASTGDRRFVQATFDGEVRFPTFGTQFFWLAVHVVGTAGDTAPPQRWSYLGGKGTLTTLAQLSLGGDQLLYVESNYVVPIDRIDLPILGRPYVTLQHEIGSAGIGRLPALEQNLAVRVALSLARVEVAMDPVRRDVVVGVGLSMTR